MLLISTSLKKLSSGTELKHFAVDKSNAAHVDRYLSLTGYSAIRKNNNIALLFLFFPVLSVMSLPKTGSLKDLNVC